MPKAALVGDMKPSELEFNQELTLYYYTIGIFCIRIPNNEVTFPMLTSKKSPTGPTERTPKPEYVIALATYLGVRW